MPNENSQQTQLDILILNAYVVIVSRTRMHLYELRNAKRIIEKTTDECIRYFDSIVMGDSTMRLPSVNVK